MLVEDMKNEGRKGGKLDQLFLGGHIQSLKTWARFTISIEEWKGRSDEDSNQLP